MVSYDPCSQTHLVGKGYGGGGGGGGCCILAPN